MGLAFYKKKLKQKSEELNCLRPFPSYLELNGRNELNVLDCGCGPFPTIGTQANGKKILLTACDLFAGEYLRMMKEQGIVPIVQVEKQDVCHMTYKDNSFDVVHCRNALDHMDTPRAAISELYRVCKLGGLIHLEHYRNVGLKHSYSGGHKWNIDSNAYGDCLIWNQQVDYKLSEIVAGFVSELSQNSRMVVSRLIKEV